MKKGGTESQMKNQKIWGTRRMKDRHNRKKRERKRVIHFGGLEKMREERRDEDSERKALTERKIQNILHIHNKNAKQIIHINNVNKILSYS